MFQKQRSKDASDDDESTVKNQLSSLLFVDKIIDVRLSRLQEGSDRDSIGNSLFIFSLKPLSCLVFIIYPMLISLNVFCPGLPAVVDYSKLLSERKLVKLPLDIILKNNVALSYFIDHMSSIASQVYIFAYLNMEGMRICGTPMVPHITNYENYSYFLFSGWRTSARQELAKYRDQKEKREAVNDAVFGQLTSAAQLLYEQYLTEKVTSLFYL